MAVTVDDHKVIACSDQHVLGVLEDDQPGRGVGSRHVIVPMDFAHTLTEGTPHDEPHHQFDPLGSGITEQVEEENMVGTIVDQLRMAGDDKAALLMLDREMRSRASSS